MLVPHVDNWVTLEEMDKSELSSSFLESGINNDNKGRKTHAQHNNTLIRMLNYHDLRAPLLL